MTTSENSCLTALLFWSCCNVRLPGPENCELLEIIYNRIFSSRVTFLLPADSVNGVNGFQTSWHQPRTVSCWTGHMISSLTSLLLSNAASLRPPVCLQASARHGTFKSSAGSIVWLSTVGGRSQACLSGTICLRCLPSSGDWKPLFSLSFPDIILDW